MKSYFVQAYGCYVARGVSPFGKSFILGGKEFHFSGHAQKLSESDMLLVTTHFNNDGVRHEVALA